MGVIIRGDEALHHCDGSHRWLDPDGADDKKWAARVRAHVESHRLGVGEGRPAAPVGMPAAASARRPRRAKGAAA